MAAPSDLQNATSSAAIQWTNGRGLITGATLSGLFALIIAILGGMGTWGPNGYTPNIALPLVLTGPGAVAQSSANQQLELTSPYTPGMLNTQNDILRAQVGNIGPNFESGAANLATAAITAAIRIPPGTFTGAYTGGDAAIQAVAISDSTGSNYKSGIAVDAIAGIGTSGAFVEAENASIVNCSTFVNCGGNSGLNFTNFTNIEADTNVYCMTAFANGTCPLAGRPTGPTLGIVSQYNGTAYGTSNVTAFRVNGSPDLGAGPLPWLTGFESISGGALVGLSLGATSNAPGTNSQNILLTAITPAGAATQANIVEDNAGTMHLGPTNMDLGISASYPQVRLANTGNTGGEIFETSLTGSGVTENLLLQTGTISSFGSLQVADGAQLAISSGVGLSNGISIQPAKGNIVFLPPSGGSLLVGSAVGLSCSGSPSANFATVDGIVTHC